MTLPTGRGVPRPMPAAPISAADYPVFRQFARGYLHEDYLVEHGSAARARQAFVDEASPRERRAFARECGRLDGHLAALPLRDVRRILAETFGCAWNPRSRHEVSQILGTANGPSGD